MDMDGIDSLVKALGILLLLAVIRLDWAEGAAIAEARAQQLKGPDSHASLFATTAWWITSLLDDLFASGVLVAVIRIIGGGSGWNIIFALPWVASTFLLLRSSGQFHAWDLSEKVADDIRDGWAVATFVLFWAGWADLSVPSFNISF